MTRRSNLAFSPVRPSPGASLFSALSVPGACPACPELLGDPVGMASSLSAVFSCSPLATRHSPPSSVIPGGSNRLENLAPNCKLSAVNCRLSPLSPIIPAPLATAALRVVPVPIFTTTLRIHVGAPTFWGTMYRAPTGGAGKARDQWGTGEVECGPERLMRNIRGIMPRHTAPRIQYTSMKASMADWRCNSPYSMPCA
jgi:hypothetical protein